jgi:hypothetical protein
MPLGLVLLIGVGTFGLGLLYAVPAYFIARIKESKDSSFQYRWHCGICKYEWLRLPPGVSMP